MKKFDRITAIGLYNEICDKIGLYEDERLDDSLGSEDQERVEKLNVQIAEYKIALDSDDEEAVKSSELGIKRCEDTISEIKEKSDMFRESAIKSIMNGSLTINEDDKIELSLRFPPKRPNGEIRFKSVVFKERFTVGELNNTMQGVKQDDMTGMANAQLACRIGIAREFVSGLDYRDYQSIMAVNMLFTRAD